MTVNLKRLLEDKENAERILENLKDGIIAHDNERRIFFFNRAAEEITGYSKADILEKDCHEAFGDALCGDRCSFLCKPPGFDFDNIEYPLNILTKKGTYRRIEMSVTKMTDANGRLSGILAAFRDVTDLINLKIRLGELTSFSGIVGQDDEMIRIFEQIRVLATYDYPVMISGETGTGKELVASAIHKESSRSSRPFIPINCGALPEGILESELFGHEKGAFTGAARGRKGRFELADGGTLFLDEVADLPKGLQATLLRVLQEGTFERLGGEKTVSVKVRIISATNRDLNAEVRKGNFREDLFYRLKVVPVNLPPLRERKTDIPLLTKHFLENASQHGGQNFEVTKEALFVLMNYNWPGNVRELQNTLHFALVNSMGGLIRGKDLPAELTVKRSGRGTGRKLNPGAVRDALVQTNGNKTEAARLLGVGRATLYRFLDETPVSHETSHDRR
jgi:sigma-54 dependent transcriptional regulator, acetoin dehydrogenase operon transcriptional activator AcoR